MTDSVQYHETADQRWGELDTDRQSLLTRCEKYAAFTLPKICLPNGYNQNNNELQHDYQSLGAQATNHLTNKLMLALFAPSRPFFRLDPGDKMKAKLAEMQVDEVSLASMLAAAEKSAVRILDQRAVRPKMYEVIKHLIVTGNALLCLEEKVKVLGLKNYVCKRSPDGTVLEVITKESVAMSAMKPGVVTYLVQQGEQYDRKKCMDMYTWVIRKADGRYHSTKWVEKYKLPDNYGGVWTEEKMPYRAITWDLASGDDYGTGLVEEYTGDFASLSMLSEGTIQAALLASEFRWLVNPGGMTKPEDFNNSSNGDALPGVKGDIELLQSGKGTDLSNSISIAQDIINRIGRGFLLLSAVTRDAERVTAEEIRLTAEELETGLGGAYSRIAVDLQVPMAYWLMDQSNQKIAGTDLKPSVVTGLDALSRVGDRDQLVLFLGDLSGIAQIPEDVRARLKLTPIISQLAAARGLAQTDYIKPEEQVAQEQEQRRQLALQNQAASANIEAQAANQGQ